PDPRLIARWLRDHYVFASFGDFAKASERSKAVLAAAGRMYLAREEEGRDEDEHEAALERAGDFVCLDEDRSACVIAAGDLQARTASDRDGFYRIVPRQNWGDPDELRHWPPADEALPLAHFWTEAGKAAAANVQEFAEQGRKLLSIEEQEEDEANGENA